MSYCAGGEGLPDGTSFAVERTDPFPKGPNMEFIAGAMLLYVVLVVAGLAIWIWALVDAITNPGLDPTMRLIWVLVIIFTSIIGAIIYLVIGRSAVRRSPM
jgi:hypothetical protein